MLVPDFMHEFELGVFKAFFIHLLRILVVHGGPAGTAINELDRRFRLIPTFGQSTIRRFTANTSALKKLAAWNYQAILICLIPVVEGLLPEPFNSEVLNVLFTLAEWHSLAKLKMHTDSSISLFKLATREIGRQLRRFKRQVCSQFKTKELPSEEAARGRRKVAAAKKRKGTGRAAAAPRTDGQPANSKEFSLHTYKMHALGGYPSAVLHFGTTDSYLTQPVNCLHFGPSYQLLIFG
ncbi:hypothetical protein B0H16DRAFT_1345296 [Mycena metata]|uniref:Uncharacterized protein n=1 Tax=Mycena metata TaxID=1033252 RepID=A0AAD7GXG5_9AGAR|nr:hypothetical protein B0H16DRAFT_1345296 [Mycena metata]